MKCDPPAYARERLAGLLARGLFCSRNNTHVLAAQRWSQATEVKHNVCVHVCMRVSECVCVSFEGKEGPSPPGPAGIAEQDGPVGSMCVL